MLLTFTLPAALHLPPVDSLSATASAGARSIRSTQTHNRQPLLMTSSWSLAQQPGLASLSLASIVTSARKTHQAFSLRTVAASQALLSAPTATTCPAQQKGMYSLKRALCNVRRTYFCPAHRIRTLQHSVTMTPVDTLAQCFPLSGRRSYHPHGLPPSLRSQDSHLSQRCQQTVSGLQ